MPRVSPAKPPTPSSKSKTRTLAEEFSHYAQKPSKANAESLIRALHQLRIKGVAFDMDGTLVNSEHINLRIAEEGLSRYGVELTEKEKTQYTGNTIAGFCEKILTQRNQTDPKGKAKTISDSKPIQLARFLKQGAIKTFDKVISFVKLLHKEGFNLALVTSSQENALRQILKHFKLNKYFGIQLARENFPNNVKPHPKPYQLAMGYLDIDFKSKSKAKKLLVFEDSSPGVISAHEAGATVIALKNLTDQEFKNIPEADERLLHLDLSH